MTSPRRRIPTERPPLPPDPRSSPRPFLKWVGGKGQLLPQIWPLLPTRFERYFEPFLGGGAMFFALRPGRAFLSDVNQELIDCYTAVRDQVGEVIRALREHRYEREHYYEVRALDPADLGEAERAARTIFLNRTGFNGLYRVNRSGKFNVPFGRYTNPSICDERNLRACSEALAGAELRVRDFTHATVPSRRNDLVYFDPPYVPVSATSSFTAYSAAGFNAADQARLAHIFEKLARRGVTTLLSNADVPSLRALYEPFLTRRVMASRNINVNAAKRGKVGEVVVLGEGVVLRSAPPRRRRVPA